jgi:hypothetical protein
MGSQLDGGGEQQLAGALGARFELGVRLVYERLSFRRFETGKEPS